MTPFATQSSRHASLFRLARRGAFPHAAWCVVVVVLALVPAIGTARAQTPLIDLGAGQYKGYSGGLYPQGANAPPPAHATLAAWNASQVLPRTADGTPGKNGAIGMIAIGMSNAAQAFRAFEHEADHHLQRNGALVVVNGAIGSRPSESWADPAADVWGILDQRVVAAGLSARQVQVAWIKLARGSISDTRFPAHALVLRDQLGTIVRELRRRYPNLRLAYITSRSYGGYTPRVDRGEPLSYETGFSVKWLIERQIAGDIALNADPARGSVVAPVLLWGPYIWANGGIPNSEGLFYTREDYESDAIHPSPQGEAKIAARLSAFFRAQPWFMRQDPQLSVVLTPTDDAWVDELQPNANTGHLPSLRARGVSGQRQRSLLRFDLSPLDGLQVLRAKLALTPLQISTLGFRPRLRMLSPVWSQSTVTYANAPIAGVPPEVAGPGLYSDNAWAADVRSLLPAQAGPAGFEVSTDQAHSVSFSSSEGPSVPYLLVTVSVPKMDAPVLPATRVSTSAGMTLPGYPRRTGSAVESPSARGAPSGPCRLPPHAVDSSCRWTGIVPATRRSPSAGGGRAIRAWWRPMFADALGARAPSTAAAFMR